MPRLEAVSAAQGIEIRHLGHHVARRQDVATRSPCHSPVAGETMKGLLDHCKAEGTAGTMPAWVVCSSAFAADPSLKPLRRKFPTVHVNVSELQIRAR